MAPLFNLSLALFSTTGKWLVRLGLAAILLYLLGIAVIGGAVYYFGTHHDEPGTAANGVKSAIFEYASRNEDLLGNSDGESASARRSRADAMDNGWSAEAATRQRPHREEPRETSFDTDYSGEYANDAPD